MKDWTVQKLVIAGVVVVIIASLLSCFYTLKELHVIEHEVHGLQDREMAELALASQIQLQVHKGSRHLYEIFNSQSKSERDQLIARIRTYTASNSTILGQIDSQLTTALQEGYDDPSALMDPQLLTRVKQARQAYGAVRDELLKLVEDGNVTEALQVHKERLWMLQEDYIRVLDEMTESSKKRSENSLAEIGKAAVGAKNLYLGLTALTVLVTLAIGVTIILVIGATLKQLMLALIQVNGTSKEMTATLKEQQVSANEVASTSVEIGATAKEISATTKELGKTMADVSTVSEQTAQLAVGGQAGLSRLEGTMGQIMDATATISAKLAILNDKTSNINTVVTTINKVADQTNLLSLNAAIEAEKAGDFGHGFSVVATEIRRLADQTAVATYDIEQMVKEMQSAVAAGVMGMDKFAEEVRRGNEEVCGVTVQLVQIIQRVQALTPRFEAVNEGMQSQTAAAGQISDALVQLGETAQQSAHALRQNTEAVDQLSIAARGLQKVAARFKAMD